MLVLLPAPTRTGSIPAVSLAARGRQLQQRSGVLVEHLPEHRVQLRVLFLQQVRRLEEILGQNRKEFVFVRVGVIVDVGTILGRMGKFLCHVLHPMLDGLPGNLRREAMFGLFLLHQVSELMNTHVVFARRVVEPREERRLGKNHHAAEVLQPDHAKNVLVGAPCRLILLPERVGVDEHFTQSMVFPIVEPEDGDHRAGGNQNPNGVIDLGPDASDPDLIKENLDELPESFFLMVWQRSKKGDVRLKNLFPRSGERLFHDPQPPEASPPDQPVDERTETQREKHRREKPARNRGRHRHHAGKREGMVAVSTVVLGGHQHGRVLLARMANSLFAK